MEAVAILLHKTAEAIAQRQRFPESTYRLQFHAGFTFRDASRIVPYLADLGITHIYASPYLKACPGSTHGYDITDHRQLNPEIGSDEDYEAFVQALHQHGLGQILDMVPNHMGISCHGNVWWNDVLENGPASPYASFFDIAWHASPRPELHNRILLPVLGDPYGKVLESGQIALAYEKGAFFLRYGDRRFPVAPCSYGAILTQGLDELTRSLEPSDEGLLEYQSILTAIHNLPRYSELDPARVAERQREKEVIKRRLAALTEANAAVRETLERIVALFNGTPGQAASFDRLHGLLEQQPYRLAFWRVASDEINYRRFFDVNELAALSAERDEVFEASHELIFHLIRAGKVNGLRIDHPDGLFDPRQYLERLQRRYALDCARSIFETDDALCALQWPDVEQPSVSNAVAAGREMEPRNLQWQDIRALVCERISQEAADRNSIFWRPLYVVVEKILGDRERLPSDWPTHGTSGYEFLNQLNGLFVDAANAEGFTRLYQGWIGDDTSFAEMVYQKKFLILQVALSGELYMLAHQLDRLAQKNRWSRDFTLTTLRHALREVIACFPVYRSYISRGEYEEADRMHVLAAVERARARNPAISASVFRFLRNVLLLENCKHEGENGRAEHCRFVGKFEQVTAPVMAKGVEDTSFYVYNRLLSLNEVGGNPGRFGVSPEALHRTFSERQNQWPRGISALSTHDTKRSEDVRARLNVLSELPALWQESLSHFSEMNKPHRRDVEGEAVPGPNEEYLLYQTLIGAWPLGRLTAEQFEGFVRRIQHYMVKALHEAKVHTSWINPNEDYDQAIQQFVAGILDQRTNTAFLQDFQQLQRRISHYGLLNSLAQTLLKITAPGVPDTYQGTEGWDFSLVDPDNRRPVDYEHRASLLKELRARAQAAEVDRRKLVQELLHTKEDGRIKLYVISEALRCRRQRPGLFATGNYVPLQPDGSRSEHVFGFARRQGEQWAIVAVPRLLTRLTPDVNQLPLGPEVWQDTALAWPGPCPAEHCRNVFTAEELPLTSSGDRLFLPADKLFASFPVALYVTP